MMRAAAAYVRLGMVALSVALLASCVLTSSFGGLTPGGSGGGGGEDHPVSSGGGASSGTSSTTTPTNATTAGAATTTTSGAGGAASSASTASSGETSSTASGGEKPFPSTGVIDDFNQADGPVGGSWLVDSPASVSIAGQELLIAAGDPGAMLWSPSFGSDQEVFLTIGTIKPADYEIELLLRSQASAGECDALELSYRGQALGLFGCSGGNTMGFGGDVALSLEAGDQLGARSYASGLVQAFKNGVLIGTWDTSAWNGHDKPGRIGLAAYGIVGPDTFDDFGGGTLSP